MNERNYIVNPVSYFTPYIVFSIVMIALFALMTVFADFASGMILTITWVILLITVIARIIWHQNQDDKWFHDHMFDKEVKS